MSRGTRKILILFLILSTFCTLFLYGCSGSLSGKAYLEERGMSAIDIVGEAKYVYDMVTYTGKNVDFNDSIKDESGKEYFKAIDGEIATFTYDELIKHLGAYFNDDFIKEITKDNIIQNNKNEIYTAAIDAECGIDYIDYEVKKVEKKDIVYKVTVFYNATWNGKNPAAFEVEQKCLEKNWVFIDDNDFKWGISPNQ